MREQHALRQLLLKVALFDIYVLVLSFNENLKDNLTSIL